MMTLVIQDSQRHDPFRKVLIKKNKFLFLSHPKPTMTLRDSIAYSRCKHGFLRSLQIILVLLLFIADLPISIAFSVATKSSPQKLIGSNEKSLEANQQKFLVLQGPARYMIQNAPALGGITLCKGWTDAATQAFTKAINSVVKANPILTGHAYVNGDTLWIQSGTFTPENHNFCEIMPPPRVVPDLDSLNATELLNYCSKDLLPIFFPEPEMSSDQIANKLPLFKAGLCHLNDEYTVFMFQVSHTVGDGMTFFELLKQVSMFMNKLDVRPIQWNNTILSTHQLYPPGMTEQDIWRLYGPPLLVGALKNILTICRKPHFLLLDKHKVSNAKRALREELQTRDISSNDVITAAICQSDVNADVFIYTETIRTRDASLGAPINAGGNLHWEIPVSREIGCHPEKLRRVIASKKSGFGPNKVPLMPFLSGRHARITSLATVTEGVMYEGIERTLAVVPNSAFVKSIPMDVALIFRFNEQYWGVLHNFDRFKPSPLLKQLL